MRARNTALLQLSFLLSCSLVSVVVSGSEVLVAHNAEGLLCQGPDDAGTCSAPSGVGADGTTGAAESRTCANILNTVDSNQADAGPSDVDPQTAHAVTANQALQTDMGTASVSSPAEGGALTPEDPPAHIPEGVATPPEPAAAALPAPSQSGDAVAAAAASPATDSIAGEATATGLDAGPPAPLAPPGPAERPLKPLAAGLDELRTLLTQARAAVAALEAAVAREEARVRGVAAGLAAAAVAAAAEAAAADAAGGDAVSALLRSLGLDADGAAAARQALREALQGVGAPGRGAPALAPQPSPVPAAAHTAPDSALRSGIDPGGADGDWFAKHFALRAAAWLPADVTCAFPYELPHPNAAAAGGGPLVYVAVGDAAGGLHLLSPATGAVLSYTNTGAAAAVTACSAYFVRKGESTVVTGHANGQTRSFAVVQELDLVGANGGGGGARGGGKGAAAASSRDPAAAAATAIRSVTLRHVVPSMPPGALPWAAVEELIGAGNGAAAALGPGAAAADAAAAAGVERAAAAGGGAAAAEGGQYAGPPAPIMHILPYKLGGKVGGRRHVAVLDRAGNLRLDRENGTARHWAPTNRTQLAARFVGNYLVMLSAQHATVMNTLQPRVARAFGCAHLNGSRLLAAAFDAHRPFRSYGLNARGELLSIVTPHEGRLSACKVHRATPLPFLDAAVPAAASPPSVGLAALRGYLLLTHGSARVLFNVSGLLRSGIPTVTATDDARVAALASRLPPPPPYPPPLTGDAAPAPAPPAQPLATSQLPPSAVVAVGPGSQAVYLVLRPPPPPPSEQAIVLAVSTEGGTKGGGTDGGGGAGAGLLVLLDTRLPLQAPPQTGKMWTQPIFIGAMLLVGLYQFWRMGNGRSSRRAAASHYRSTRRRLGGAGVGGMGGGGMFGEANDYMYGEGRMPLQPRSALRRGRGPPERFGAGVVGAAAAGRHVSYREEDEDDEY